MLCEITILCGITMLCDRLTLSPTVANFPYKSRTKARCYPDQAAYQRAKKISLNRSCTSKTRRFSHSMTSNRALSVSVRIIWTQAADCWKLGRKVISKTTRCKLHAGLVPTNIQTVNPAGITERPNLEDRLGLGLNGQDPCLDGFKC